MPAMVPESGPSLPRAARQYTCRQGARSPCLSRSHGVIKRYMPPPGPVSRPSFRAPPKGRAPALASHRYQTIEIPLVREFRNTHAGGTNLLNRVREAIRTRHYTRRAEQTYCAWIWRFIELLGHRVSTTMIYTHVLNRGWRGVRSPADALPSPQGDDP